MEVGMRGIIRTGVMAVLVAVVGVGGGAQVAVAQSAAAPIRLVVDASQAPQKILHVHMEIPVAGGPLTLYYPEWIPGEHMPDGPIIQVAGVKFNGGGETDPWGGGFVGNVFVLVGGPPGVERPGG